VRKPAIHRSRRQARLPGDERQQRIVEEAARLFAEAGFAGSTRELARRLGVTQALLYRYFPSKERLIDRVYQTIFVDRWGPEWDALLGDRSRDLAERLTRFYQAYAAQFTRVSLRLFMRSGLDEVGLARRYSVPLTDRILRPICRELRYQAGLPGFDTVPMTRGERELAMVLHGGVAFIGIRKYIYGVPIEDVNDLVALHVRAFLERADDVTRALATEATPASLARPLMEAPRSRSRPRSRRRAARP
jgi:AcrR family transcriptional regulator